MARPWRTGTVSTDAPVVTSTVSVGASMSICLLTAGFVGSSRSAIQYETPRYVTATYTGSLV